MTRPEMTRPSTSPSEGQLAFLHRIAHDDRFRAEVEADPGAKLAEFGLRVDPENLPSEVRLPSKQAIRDSGVLADSTFFEWLQKWFGLLG